MAVVMRRVSICKVAVPHRVLPVKQHPASFCLQTFLTATLAVALLMTSGCVGVTGKGAVGGAGSVALSVSPAAMSFGNVRVGTSTTQKIIITNDGTANLTVTSVTVSGSGFTIGGMIVPATLKPGGTDSLEVTYTASSGSASGTLRSIRRRTA